MLHFQPHFQAGVEARASAATGSTYELAGAADVPGDSRPVVASWSVRLLDRLPWAQGRPHNDLPVAARIGERECVTAGVHDFFRGTE
jgi:hypothetical protein